MAIYKDKKRGTWYFRVYIDDKFSNRKQKCKSGFKTKGEAKNEEQLFLLKNKEQNIDCNITFQELCEIYLKHKKQTLKPKSFVTNKNIIINHLLPYFKDYKINKIDNKTYIEWKEKILEKGFSYKYNSSIHICMVNILNYAMNFYGLEKNIASKVGNFSKNNYMPKVDFWTYEEFSKFIENIKEIEYRSLFITLYFTGARLGECIALNWNDIKDNYIDINKTISRGDIGENYIIQTPKTKSSIRKIQLDDYTIKILNDLKEYYKGFIGFNNNWFVFGGIKPLARTTITTKKDNYCKLSNIKQIRIHDFRHSHASLLISKGVPLTVISKRLGHKDLSTTLNKYSHLIPEDEDKAINLINNLEKNF
ncbi:MAG: site-specific integrase [Firmicutes bacterium]|nr:site-specific integrase [Bacillota bacterium]